MKLAILSMQQINNYGSVLQAYSLKKIMQGLGADVSFIDIIPGEDINLNEECSRIARDNGLGNIYITASILKKIGYRISGYNSNRIFETFRRDYLRVLMADNSNQYDYCVIGSDEVFNCIQESKWGFSRQLFGDIKNAQRIITYAASCGATQTNLLTDELRWTISQAFSHIERFSVRDENSRRFVEELSKKKAEIHLDPVAIGDFADEISNVSDSSKLPTRYCVLYSYANRFTDSSEIETIRKFCKDHDLTLISLYGKQDWVKNSAELRPFELLKAFQNASFVITDTFHGALFGAKYAKKIAVVIRNSNRNKLQDLAHRLKIEENIVSDFSKLNDLWYRELDRNQIDKILMEERNRSINYLESCLQND